MDTSESRDEYIASLDMKVDIHKAQKYELLRIAELTERANKFTNGKRYTFNELQSYIKESNYELYSVCVSDKFSSLGVVGALGFISDRLELFVLSCRALGRGIECKMLEQDIIKWTSYEFYSTGKNQQVKVMLDRYLYHKN